MAARVHSWGKASIAHADLADGDGSKSQVHPMQHMPLAPNKEGLHHQMQPLLP